MSPNPSDISIEDFRLEALLAKGVLIGSRAYKVPTKNSDWDIVLYEKDFPKLNYLDYKNIVYDYHVCIDFTEVNEANDADGQEDTDYVKDGSTVWGQKLIKIIKIWTNEDDEDEVINLFIYENDTSNLYDKFRQLNATMMFTLTKEQRADRTTRVERFAELLDRYEIGN